MNKRYPQKNYLCKNLKYLRNDIRQEDIAKMVGVGRNNYQAWEKGRAIPQTEHLLKLSLLYCVSIDYLVRKDLSMIKDIEIKMDFHIVQNGLAQIDILNNHNHVDTNTAKI